MTHARQLRQMLGSGSIVVAPGAFDAWSAKLVERAGFGAVYMTGYGASASLLAMPDLGLMSSSEMIGQARRLANAVAIPLIADADNGFGDVLNVQRTMREYERAGVAAIQIEDQVSPKKCGHMENKQIVSTEQMVRNIKAAVAARNDKNVVIIARTDARTVVDLDEALRRADACAEAGADMLFIESPLSDKELEDICRRFSGIPLLANMAPGSKTPYHSAAELQEIGFSLVIYPIDTLLAATGTMLQTLEYLKASGKVPDAAVSVDFRKFNDLMELPKYMNTADSLR